MIERKAADIRIEYLPLALLKKAPNNTRTHSTKQIKKLGEAIKKFGFNNPILIDDNNVIVAGHARSEAALLVKQNDVPIIRLSHLTEEQVRAYRLADNRLSELSEWNEQILKIELKELSVLNLDFDLSITGFETADLDRILIEPEIVAEGEAFLIDSKPPITKLGDIWVLGKHRVFCGDALIKKSYDILLDQKIPNLVFTDPPYNVPIKGHVISKGMTSHSEFAMASGEMSENEYQDFLDKIICLLNQYTADGSIHYICMDWRHIHQLLFAGYKYYSELKNICIWNKSNGGMGSLYRSKHEMVCVFKNGKKPHINNIELGKHGRSRTNVWDYSGQSSFHSNRKKEIDMHPTVKPLPLVIDAICDCSNRDDIVLDCFGGSGTTLIAAEHTNRRACLIELEPKYIDVTIQRWQSCTGIDAYNFDNGKSFNEVEKEAL